MHEGGLVVAATEEDVDYFARRRTADEQSFKLYHHLAQTAPNGVYVAKDEGTPVGIAVAHAAEDEWYLSELFVEPSFRNHGVGASLLREAAQEAGEVTRSATLEADETGAIAFSLQRGVALQTPVFELSGAIPHENELARMAAGEYRFTTEAIDLRMHRAPLVQLDREVRGSARLDDHSYLASAGNGFVFRRGEEIVGYAYVWPNGRIGPLAAASHAYATQFFAFSLATLQRLLGASWCTALVPGINVRILRTALRAGLTIGKARIFASDGGLCDLTRYVGFHPLLF